MQQLNTKSKLYWEFQISNCLWYPSELEVICHVIPSGIKASTTLEMDDW